MRSLAITEIDYNDKDTTVDMFKTRKSVAVGRTKFLVIKMFIYKTRIVERYLF